MAMKTEKQDDSSFSLTLIGALKLSTLIGKSYTKSYHK